MAAIKFSKQSIRPNPMEVDYWVDITSNPYGGNIKYFNGYDWVDLLNAKGKPVNLDAYYNKLQMNLMLSEKASVESVNSKVDDTEVADVIKNIEFKDRGDEGVEMVVLKYDGMTVGVTLPTASNTTSGIITNKSFKDLVKQNQLQGVYSEMYDKLSEIRKQYQRKLKAGKNIQIDENNTIHAIGEISLDWDDIYNKPDFDKLFASVALAIQSESNRAKSAEQQLSARITDHVDVVEGKLDLKADASSVYTKDQIDEKISGIYKIKGSRTFQDLPTSGNSIGDVYNITNNFTLDGVEYPFGTNVVYTATGWDALAGIFDSTEIENKVDEIDTKIDEEVIRAKEKELELDKKFDDYLPLSGGTIVGLSTAFRIKRNTNNPSLISFLNTTGPLGGLGMDTQNIPAFFDYDLTNVYRLLHEGNYSDYALPLTGGTVTGKTKIETNSSAPLHIASSEDTTGIQISSINGSGYLLYKDDSNYYVTDRGWYNKYKIWHEGNDGEGSGLDADTLDGVHLNSLFKWNLWFGGDVNTCTFGSHLMGGNVSNSPVSAGTLLSFSKDNKGGLLIFGSNFRFYFRSIWDKFGDWKTIAYTDDDITGNAATATKATQDSEGNVITDTYALKSDITIDYNATDGVYAVAADGKLIDYNSADETALGVALIVGEHKFMIAKSDATNDDGEYYLYWTKNMSDLSLPNYSNVDGTNEYGLFGEELSNNFTTWTAGALSDFNGKANTEIITAASSDALDMCTVLKTFNQTELAAGRSADWYVPACGQLALMCLNLDEINTALTKIGGTALILEYWSSSEYDSRNAWPIVFYDNVIYGVAYKNNVYTRVRFIRDLTTTTTTAITKKYLEEKIPELELSVSDCYSKEEIDKMFNVSKYEFVDLGLPSGLKWAAWNVGATKPEDFGLYFAWGETRGYNGITDTKRFEWDDYELCNGSYDTLTKYNNDSSYGVVDNLTTLEQVDDAAYQSDNTCRMPTRAELEELIANTTSKWETLNGVNGRRFTSNTNGNSIFIPAASRCSNGSVGSVGYGGYLWISSLHENNSGGALHLRFTADYVDMDGNYRFNGFSVRAVQEPNTNTKFNPSETVSKVKNLESQIGDINAILESIING